jgi:hypothetical protein
VPTHRDLLEYVTELYHELASETRKFIPSAHVQRMKKTLAYISHGLEGTFEHDMRRAILFLYTNRSSGHLVASLKA